MRARVYNKSENKYYISEVYAVINRAGDWYLVDDLYDKNIAVLVRYLGSENYSSYEVNVEIIDANRSDVDFIYIDEPEADSVNSSLVKSNKLHYFRGPQSVWNCRQALIELLENDRIEKNRICIPQTYSTKLPDWNYIETEQDIQLLMENFAWFEDSIIKEISYIPGEYVDKDNTMHGVNVRIIKVVFNSQQTRGKGLELILLSPRIVHIVPPEENELSCLYDASVFVDNYKVFFYDSYMESIPEDYEGTYFISMGMMWKLIEQEKAL